jgi:hypothetical protein
MSRMRQRVGAWRLRRILATMCGALVAVSILMVFNLQVSVTHGGTVELINGRSDTQALAVPLALFIVGAGGLMAALGWRPERE